MREPRSHGSPVRATDLARRIDQARGLTRADLVIKGARVFNLVTGELNRSDIAVCGDTIVGTGEEGYRGVVEIDGRGLVAVPGFIDTHLHPESTLVLPGEFERLLLARGTTTAIADPHEIANVEGRAGLEYYLDSAAALTLDLRINLSSCVPASALETSGATLSANDLVSLRDHPQVLGLAEMMNIGGVLAKDPDVLAKLAAFQELGIDGHAPLLRGRDLNAYLACGIRNCHESTSLEEAFEKLSKGMRVLIRDGSVTRDVVALAPLIDVAHSPFLAFCTDDRTPLHIAEDGHIDHLIRTAIAAGRPPLAVYRAASWAAAAGFGLRDRGLIAPGQRADIVLLRDLQRCDVARVIQAGRIADLETLPHPTLPAPVGYGSIRRAPVTAEIFRARCAGPSGPVIGLRRNQILTDALRLELPYRDGARHADTTLDVAKVAVLERHGRNGNVGVGFVRGFGLRGGALASSVGHDAHNIIVVGHDDADMALAVNRLIDLQGGFVAAQAGQLRGELPLPVAGLISDRSAAAVEHDLRALRLVVNEMGCTLDEPFVQMAFLPLSVVPHLKITDHGLVDVDRGRVIGLDD
ncbi:MAG: adenine deaminase [Proteobacteria bacterium]|nr:adenine deaminase [Pseudomonadota bacterium]